MRKILGGQDSGEGNGMPTVVDLAEEDWEASWRVERIGSQLEAR